MEEMAKGRQVRSSEKNKTGKTPNPFE